jgi:ATP-dependent RNA helicase DDX10/DBP4
MREIICITYSPSENTPNPTILISMDRAVSSSTTPCSLAQYYSVCMLDKKLDLLWSFIKTPLHSKVLVFLSTGKPVHFVFETFCKMHPGTLLLHLHGKQKQCARLTIYTQFAPPVHAALFATDITAHSFDFPLVNWVVQVDASEDVNTYIHEVGGTAHCESSRSGLLLPIPSEEQGMKAALEKTSIKIENSNNVHVFNPCLSGEVFCSYEGSGFIL